MQVLSGEAGGRPPPAQRAVRADLGQRLRRAHTGAAVGARVRVRGETATLL